MSTLPQDFAADPTSIVQITGPSGSGKTTIAWDVLRAMGSPTVNADGDLHEDERPLIDVYRSRPGGLKMLSSVGLTDASALARNHAQLSVGQQARDKLGRSILAGGQVIVVDEYLAHLDRLTAKSTAWAVSKTLRKLGIGAIFITANDDIADDVNPDIWIETGWQDKPKINAAQATWNTCSVVDDVEVIKGTRTDWLAFKPLHYAAGEPATTHSIWKVQEKQTNKCIGVVVYSYPDLHSAARNLATENQYSTQRGRNALNALNREVVKMSRLVIAPQVRSIGLAHLLLSESIPHLGAKYVETVTSMGRFSTFLERVGFRQVPTSTHDTEAEWLDWCDQHRPPAAPYLSGYDLMTWIDSLSVRDRRRGRRLVWNHYHHFVLHRRTRSKRPKNVPNPGDPRWEEAADLASRRMIDRPDYYIVGPIDPMTGMPDQAA